MMMKLLKYKIFLPAIFIFNLSPSFFAQPKSAKNRILFVFDASNSMRTKYDGKPRIEHAKLLFNKFIDSLSRFKNYEFALRMYGSTVKYPPGDCNDSKLIIPFGKGTVSAMKKAVNAAKPTGITPIEHSLTASASDFPDKNAINTILLITDGIEECKGDPCEARKKLLEKGIVFKPCIIGIGLTTEQAKTFECVGDYFSYEDASSFSEIVSVVSSRQLMKTSAQVNLLDIAAKPSETNVNLTFYDAKSGEIVYNLVHAMNAFNLPDTVTINEFRTYKVTAHTIPPVESAAVQLNPGTHTLIPIDVPQGYLKITIPDNYYNRNDKVKYVIRKERQAATLHVPDVNKVEKLIVGQYDIEALTLPRTQLSGVKINQSLTNNIDIPEPGILQLSLPSSGVGAIFTEETGQLKWVCNLNTEQTLQSYNLQPGKYLVTYRSKLLKQSIYTVQKRFTVKSNDKVNVNMVN